MFQFDAQHKRDNVITIIVHNLIKGRQSLSSKTHFDSIISLNGRRKN